jgi:hypothetical protein
MQRFSASLAKMQLPIVLGSDNGGGVVQKEEKTPDNKVIEQGETQISCKFVEFDITFIPWFVHQRQV